MGKDLKGKELGSGIRQKANGTYSGRYIDHFGNRKELYNKNLRQLRQELEKAKYEDNIAINIVDTRITLDEWYEKFINVHKHGVICANTKRHYDNVYNKHISPTLGKFRLNEVTQLQVKSLLKILDKNGLKYETQNKVRLLLMDMFEKAMIDNFVQKNPAKGIKVVRNGIRDNKILI